VLCHSGAPRSVAIEMIDCIQPRRIEARAKFSQNRIDQTGLDEIPDHHCPVAAQGLDDTPGVGRVVKIV